MKSLFQLEIELLETEMAIEAYDSTRMGVEGGAYIEFLPNWYVSANLRRLRLMNEIHIIKLNK